MLLIIFIDIKYFLKSSFKIERFILLNLLLYKFIPFKKRDKREKEK